MIGNKVKKRMNSMSFKRSDCAVACTLDLIGDKWSLLIIRDLLLGKHRYKEFTESRERIPTNILANRLQRLEQAGIISRVPYQEKPLRYEYHLTAAGKELEHVIRAIVFWADKHLPGVRNEMPD